MGDLPPGVFRVCGKYRLRKKIGSGSFSEGYYANNVLTGEGIAVKMESLDADNPKPSHEWKVYKALGGGPGIPRVSRFGAKCGYQAMTMNLLGPSLEDLFDACNRDFTLKTVLMLADQLISHVEYIHSQNYIHHDIKPDNLLIGAHCKRHLVNIINFGLANRYCNEITLIHIPYHTYKHLVGTACYASINSHLGIEQAQRDDLESLAYNLIYFLCGLLPWQHFDASPRTKKHHGIMQQKSGISVAELCSGIPDEFHTFLCYTWALAFTAEPDYTYVCTLFQDLFDRCGYQDDGVFDWSERTER
ncbi:kinase-like protein [Tricholoma matsutake]|nr:kinase-like protein [Tricholoma matsutake 945]